MCGCKSALVGHIPIPFLIPHQLNYCLSCTNLQSMFFTFKHVILYTCVILLNEFFKCWIDDINLYHTTNYKIYSTTPFCSFKFNAQINKKS